LVLNQSGCDISGQLGSGSIASFRPSCDIQGTIEGSALHFPAQQCLFKGETHLDFFSGSAVDELNGTLSNCRYIPELEFPVYCNIHLERER
jgi:hypothetical protein